MSDNSPGGLQITSLLFLLIPLLPALPKPNHTLAPQRGAKPGPNAPLTICDVLQPTLGPLAHLGRQSLDLRAWPDLCGDEMAA